MPPGPQKKFVLRAPSSGIVRSPSPPLDERRGNRKRSLPSPTSSVLAVDIARRENDLLARRNAELLLRCAQLERQAQRQNKSAHHPPPHEQHFSATTPIRKRAMRRDYNSSGTPLLHDDENPEEAPQVTSADELTDDADVDVGYPSSSPVPPPPPLEQRPNSSSIESDLGNFARGLHDLTLRLLFLCAEWMPSSSCELASVISGGGASSTPAATSTAISAQQQDALGFFSQHARVIQHLEVVVRSRLAASDEIIQRAETEASSARTAADEVITLRRDVSELREALEQRDVALQRSVDVVTRSREELVEAEGRLKEQERVVGNARDNIATLSAQVVDLQRRNVVLEEAMASMQLHLMETHVEGEGSELDRVGCGHDESGAAVVGDGAVAPPRRSLFTSFPHDVSPQRSGNGERADWACNGLRTQLLVKAMQGLQPSSSPEVTRPCQLRPPAPPNDTYSPLVVRRHCPSSSSAPSLNVASLAREIFERAMKQ